MTGAPRAEVTPEDGIDAIAELCRVLEIPGLRRYGVTGADVAPLVAKAKVASSMRGNPLTLSDAELTEIAERAL
jgi:alcohol dehydrogenase class IV